MSTSTQPPAVIHTGQLAPLQAATAAQLAPLRRLLAAADFTEPAVCKRAGIDSIYDFRSIREGRTDGIELNDALDVLIRLFMDVELIERTTLERLLGVEETQTIEDLGLLATPPASTQCHAEFLLYPTASLWIASDLNIDPTNPEGPDLSDDAVYPAISKNTRHYLFSLPTTPCDNFLELCAGTGIAALIASKYARHTWATDITERATAFAQFNAALNDVENCSAARGDLYQAVEGQTFDRIVAHPPYMPSFEQKYIFRDGGDDGEQITRGAVAGLADYLRPGGRFYCTCMLTERSEAKVEDRIRVMLGPRHDEFDILLLTFWSFDPTNYYFKRALEGRATLEEVVQRHQVFRKLAVEQLVYSSFVIERHAESRQAYTARRQVGRGLGTKEVDDLMAWKAAASAPDAMERLITSPLVASPHASMRLDHTLQGERWVTQDCVLSTVTPFVVEAKCPPWMATILARCDGKRTTRDHLEFLKRSGAVPESAAESEFAELIRLLLDGGFLAVA